MNSLIMGRLTYMTYLTWKVQNSGLLSQVSNTEIKLSIKMNQRPQAVVCETSKVWYPDFHIYTPVHRYVKSTQYTEGEQPIVI